MSQSNQGSRAQWASNIGFILAAAGSAIGLGNIWKFPGKAYACGGGSFFVVYLLIVAFIGTTVMLAEFVIGRKAQKNIIGAIREINRKWAVLGTLSVFTCLLILCYYVQVGGWVLYYIFGYMFNSTAIFADPLAYFLNMLGMNGFPLMGAIICPLLFLGVCVFIIVRGIENGIEKFNKFAMPALFIILLILMIRAVTLPGAGEGIKYMLSFDLSAITGEMFLVALGQAFFSLSLGMAIMITYGSYLRKDEDLSKNVAVVCGLDTLVAFLAAFMIIPAVFATGVAPGIGGGFAFASLAGVFQNIPLGVFFGVLFYILLLFAAVTSAISLLESAVAAVTEERNIDRKKAVVGLSAILFVIGIFYTLSQVYLNIKGIWFDFTNGITFPVLGDFMEFLTDRILIPINALAACLIVGWVWGAKNGVKEVRQNGKFTFPMAAIWVFLVKFAAPVAIIVILIAGIVFGKTLS